MSERWNGFVDWARGIGVPWWSSWAGGTAGRDPDLARRRHMPEIVRLHYTPDMLREMWRTDALVARVIERPADDMTRQGWRVQTDHAELDEHLRGRQDDLRVVEVMRNLIEYTRAFGAGAGLIGVDDGRPMESELVATMAGKIKWLLPLSPEDLRPAVWDEQPGSPTYEQPLIYELHRGGAENIRVHRSRLIIMQGRLTGYRHRRENLGWGDPIIPRVVDPIRQYSLLWAMVSEVLKGHSQPVVRLKDFYDLRERPGGDDLARQRLEGIQAMRSNLRMLVLDKEDEFGFVTTSLSELVNILREHSVYISAICDIPVTLLFGVSPAGLNATGESDIRNYYDRKRGEQSSQLKPALETLATLLLREVLGAGALPNFRITFAPLWQPSEKEQAESRFLTAQADQIYVDLGVRDPDQVARSRDREGGWSADTEPRDQDLVERMEVVRATPLPTPELPAPSANGHALAPVAPTELEATALNGAQVQSALEIVLAVSTRQLPRDTGIGMLRAFFQLSPAAAEQVMGEVGRSFDAASTDGATSSPASPAAPGRPA